MSKPSCVQPSSFPGEEGCTEPGLGSNPNKKEAMMADATIAPETIEFTVTGTSRARSTWLWTRALLHKARMGIVNGATKVKVGMTNAMHTTAAAVATAGAQVALATRAGWNAGTGLLAKGLGVVAKGALLVAKGFSWITHQIGRAVGWFVGLFNKDAGRKFQEANQRFTDWRTARIMGGKARVDVATHLGHAAMTTAGPSTVGRISAGVMGVGTIANLATHGAVAAQAAAIPYIGGWAGLAFGPVGLLFTAGIAVLGGLFSWFFKKQEVYARVQQMEAEAEAKALVALGIGDGELIVNLSDDGNGGTKVTVSGHPVLVRTINSDPALMAEVAEAAFTAENDAGAAKLQTPRKAKASASA